MTLSELADLALIFLLAQVFVMGVGGAIAVFYTIRSFTRLDRELRFRLPILQAKMQQTSVTTEMIAEQLREPIIAASSTMANIERMTSVLTSSRRSK